MKAYLYRYEPVFHSAVNAKDYGAILLFLHGTLASITLQHCKQWMTHSWYL